MSTEENKTKVDHFDISDDVDGTIPNGESRTIPVHIYNSLISDFPKSIKNVGDISTLSVREIDNLLYKTEHDASNDCYMNCLQEFSNNLWSYEDDNDGIREVSEVCLHEVELLLERIRFIISDPEIPIDDENPQGTADWIKNALVGVIDRIKQMLFIDEGINRIEGLINESKHQLESNVDAVKKDIYSFEESVADIQETFKREVGRIKKGFRGEVNKIKKDLSETNKDMLSVMGVFTSIIVLIMTLVITSSSWLNNANGASAVIAFLIPSCVVILSVCALTALLSFWIKSDKRSLVPCSVVAVLTIVIGCIGMWKFGMHEVEQHNRLVFEVDRYASIDPDDPTGERIINIHFTEKISTFDGEHEIEVIIDNQKESDCIIHNNLIYYCITHNRFE